MFMQVPFCILGNIKVTLNTLTFIYIDDIILYR